MKNFFICCAMIIFSAAHMTATVKTLVNHSQKQFLVRFFYNNQEEFLDINLAPGAVEDVFLPNKKIEKIIFQDGNQVKYPLSCMAHVILKHDTSKINEKDIFIVRADAQVSMYNRSTKRDAFLTKLDQAYVGRFEMPLFGVQITTNKHADRAHTQVVDYQIEG